MSEPDISLQRKNYLLKRKHTKTAITMLRIGILVFLFVGWEIAARLSLIDSFIVSSPSRMWSTFINLYRSGDLWLHVGTSVLETVVGFLLGTLMGTVIAVLLWWSEFLSRVLDPYLVVLNALPKTALGPIFIVWIGAGPASIIAMTLAISLIVTILDMHNGFLDTDPEKIRLMRTLGANRQQILIKLVLPANFTTMINALKVNVGLSWVGVIMGEFLVSKAGLGYLIVYGSQVFKMDLVMTTVLILATAAALMYQCILWLEKAMKKYMGVTV
ncbi:MAG: ABC transporter permease [Angelakisella sp.]|nr:ABC transporter permease [Angelakisella sp.]